MFYNNYYSSLLRLSRSRSTPSVSLASLVSGRHGSWEVVRAPNKVTILGVRVCPNKIIAAGILTPSKAAAGEVAAPAVQASTPQRRQRVEVAIFGAICWGNEQRR
jgi:hypothetical protein